MALVIEAPSQVAPSVAQQIFIVGSAVASILGGIYLANKLATAPTVSMSHVAGATAISAIFTFFAALTLGNVAASEY